MLNLHVIDDDIPELNEYFRVTLVSAVSGDGKLGSTPTSGASIDPEKETTDISIRASDHPYGNNDGNNSLVSNNCVVLASQIKPFLSLNK